MARFRVNAKFSNRSKALKGQIESNLKDAMLDVVLDLKRVASASAPKDTGYLQNSAQHDIAVKGGNIEGSVGFSAVEKGFNYAEWTHDEDYELGEKSLQKSGGTSAFGGGRVPVGKGYLENALEGSRAGYLDHLEKAYRKAID